MQIYSKAIGNSDKIENIVKSELDDRLYRGLKLKNGIRALLISDPRTDKSSASLSVNVGALKDPEDVPGLAHFLEHMLFLGSEKYPDENEYSRFITDHAGISNAYTAEHQTNYYFDVNPEFFKGALDRFAQFFVAPLFESSATEREINAVHSEHEKNVATDPWRIRQVEKTICKQDHPYHQFSSGNKDTLWTIPNSKGIDIRDKLLEFYNKWYSANIMCLVVLGRESLDELEIIVNDLFSEVKCKDVDEVLCKELPFGPNELKKILYVVPIMDIRNLKLTFPVPDMIEHYKTAPDHYISNLIGHEGPGGLYALLRKKSLCNSLSCGLMHIASGIAFFTISMDLTTEGLGEIDNIVTLVFQYIELVKTNGIKKSTFKEIKKLEATKFKYKDKETPYKYTMLLSSAIADYPMEHILSANYIINEWKPDVVKDLIDYLKPENMMLTAVSKSFEEIADQSEYWYGVKYKVENITTEKIKNWKNVSLSDKLHLPPPNEFITNNFDLLSLEPNRPKNPYVFHESSLSRVWFKQDDDYLLPKLDVRIELFCPLAFLDPGNCNLTCVFVQLLKDALNEFTYAARLAELQYDILHTRYGLQLTFRGFNEKIPVLMKTVLARMLNLDIDPKRFEISKEEYIRNMKNFEAEQPHKQANYYLGYLLAECGWNKEEMLASCNVLETKNLEKFVPELFSKIFMQCLIYGNCNNKNAAELVKIIEHPFTLCAKLLPQQLVLFREVALENGTHYVYEVNNKYHSSSCYCAFYQCSLESTVANNTIELFAQIINEQCFYVLRTQEQLGYIVISGVRRLSGVQGLIVLIQSEKHPVYLNSRVECFFKSVKTMLENMTDEEFKVHVDALTTKKLERPKQMFSMTEKYWGEIATRYYNFDRVELEIQHLKTITKDDMLQFFMKHFDENAEKKRKLDVHIVSLITNPEIDEQLVDPNEKIIDNVTVFKNSLCLCPLPRAYMNIEPVGTKSKL